MKKQHLQLLFTIFAGGLLCSCTTMESRAPNSRVRGPFPGPAATAPPPYTDVVQAAPVRGPAVRNNSQARPVASTDGRTQSQASYIEDQRIAQEFRNSMKMRIDQLAQENSRLTSEIANLRTQGGNSASSSEVLTLRSKISELEGKVTSLEQRSLQNQATLQEIPQTIHSIMSNHQAKATPTRSTKPIVERKTNQGSTSNVEGYEYIVGQGDTLSAIAAAYGVSAQSIIDANQLDNPNNLRVKQKLFIPK